MAGGEEVFVACLYALVHRLQSTRFAVTARPFVQKLLADPGYVRLLRELWKSRGFDPKKLPTNEELSQALASLPDVSQSLNVLTGTEKEEQHDIGMI